ncbi:hypothetical protein [Alcanivorax sp.]|uniref:hypothetical protein n=1 Tax=Alcanivorax sp. TaxID=1872427 RepID=UPI0025C469B3|nr:hypothetical protein [Alcanivorax sp.]
MSKKKKFWLVCMYIMGTLVALIFWNMTDPDRVSGIESELLENGRFSNIGEKAIVDAAHAGELSVLLSSNPGLPKYLGDELQALKLQEEWRDSKNRYFIRVASALQRLLESSERSVIKQALFKKEGSEKRLANYLVAFISLQRKLGNGLVSSHSDTLQLAVGKAGKLLVSLRDDRDLKKELHHIASRLASEKSQHPRSSTYQEWLLQHAWELSAAELELDFADIDSAVLEGIRNDTDFTRLLSHDNDAVAKNAANLVSVFVPKNTITALRFQLIRAEDNQLRLLILEAIKSYGAQREQIEPQLKKMFRLTHKTKFKEKIRETISHLNGRPNDVGLQ